MFKKTLITLSLLAVAGSAFANATISFTDNTKNLLAKAAGIQGLSSLTKVNGNTFTIDNDAQGRTVNTTISMLSGTTPPFTEAAGNIQWNAASDNNYQMTISAGALYNGDKPSECYTMTVAVNGATIGSNTTNAQGKWNPTTVNNIALKNAKITVTTTPSSCH